MSHRRLLFFTRTAVSMIGSLALLLFGAGNTVAQTLRDPTVPPFSAGLTGVGAHASEAMADLGNLSILVRDGVPYLVLGTRLYAKGQKIGQTQVDRISETAVWLREGNTVRKLPVFSGIERHPALPASVVVKPSAIHFPAAAKP